MKNDGLLGMRGGAQSPENWRERAEESHGALALDGSLTITASEIGSFAFCPQAWYLQRCRVLVSTEAGLRREIGSRTHRQIGRQTDFVRATDVARRLLVMTMVVALTLLIVLLLRLLP